MLWLWILAAETAYFIKGLCGFVNALVFTSISSFGVSNADSSPSDLLLACSIPGALLLKTVDIKTVKLIFSVVVVLRSVEMLLRGRSRKQLCFSKLVLAVIGVTEGVLCGVFGVGALLAAYIRCAIENGSSFKANISAVFITDNIFRMILDSILGLLTPDTVKFVPLLIPFALLGLFADIKRSSHMDENFIKKLTRSCSCWSASR